MGPNKLECLSLTRLSHRHNDTWHNDIQHNDTQHNDTQHNDTQHNGKVSLMLSVTYAKCRYAEKN